MLRWRHPLQGVISADKFIAVAEDVGLVVKVGKWVVGEACRQLHAWQEKYPAAPSLSMTVNLSAKQLAHAGLIEDIKSALQSAPVASKTLQVEITERAAMADAKLTYEVLSQLQLFDVRASLSEFGAGSSSLPWLLRFPLDELKIDRNVVGSVLADRDSGDVVSLVISMARELKLKVVAEGVESAVQLNRLQALGCEFAQGYLFSHPMDAAKAEQFLQQQSKRVSASK